MKARKQFGKLMESDAIKINHLVANVNLDDPMEPGPKKVKIRSPAHQITISSVNLLKKPKNTKSTDLDLSSIPAPKVQGPIVRADSSQGSHVWPVAWLSLQITLDTHG